MGIPACDSRNAPALHSPQSTHQILDGAADDMVQAGLSVRGRRPLEENEGLSLLSRLERLLEEVFIAPTAERLFFKRKKGVRYFRIWHRFT